MAEFLIFLFVTVFPFGQLAKISILISGRHVPILLLDLVAVISLIYVVGKKIKLPDILVPIENFLLVAFGSLIFSVSLFRFSDLWLGGLYLLRLISYFGFFILVWDFAKDGPRRQKVFSYLVVSISLLAVFGWIQYLFYPDIRALLEWGWDDHLFRLVGTFLDPTFTGIILVFGSLCATAYFLEKRKIGYLVLSMFFAATLAATYSRASYLALTLGLIYMSKLSKNLLILVSCFILLTSYLLLPKPRGEGVNLARTNSVIAKGADYREAVIVISRSPIFGVGFNNVCLAKQKFLPKINPLSHSCSGFDSSILFILATTGIVGLLIFLDAAVKLRSNLEASVYSLALASSAVSLFVHSLFANSLFYPWTLGYLAVLLALSLRRVVKSK